MRSAILLAEKMAIKKANFHASCLRERLAGKPMFFIWVSTVARSHDHLGSVDGGFLAKVVLRNLATSGCAPTDGELMGWSNDEIAER